jgi:hypothetical protein
MKNNVVRMKISENITDLDFADNIANIGDNRFNYGFFKPSLNKGPLNEVS